MKLRFIFLAFGILLLTGSLAQAEQASIPTDQNTAALAAAIFSAPTSPDCQNSGLSSFASEPTVQAAAGTCGTCSDSLCQGKQNGQFCKFAGGKYYYCRYAYINCAPNDCQCWTGPLP